MTVQMYTILLLESPCSLVRYKIVHDGHGDTCHLAWVTRLERPKGAEDEVKQELEVGARKAPRLLVYYILQRCITHWPRIYTFNV